MCVVQVDGLAPCTHPDRAWLSDNPSDRFEEVEALDDMICGLRASGSVSCWSPMRGALNSEPGGVIERLYPSKARPEGRRLCR